MAQNKKPTLRDRIIRLTKSNKTRRAGQLRPLATLRRPFGMAVMAGAVAVGVIAATVPALNQESEAADIQSRAEGAVHVHNVFMRITENHTATNGYTCATDISGYSIETRRKICSLKAMGAWGGNQFNPGDKLTRRVTAKWIRELQQYANNYFGWTVRKLHTSTSITGWGHNKFADVSASSTPDKMDAGIGMMKYYGFDNGFWCPNGVNRCYRPLHGIGYTRLQTTLHRWDERADPY